MNQLFTSLYIGLSGLRANQMGISLAGNNVANINTPGYSRQRAIFAAADPLHIAEGQFGMGATVLDVSVARDRFIEARLVRENQTLGQLDTMSQNLRQIEAVFADTGGVGLRDSLNKFFASFSDLAGNPTSTAVRQQVLSAGNNLAGSIRSAYTQLTATQNTANQDVKATVNQINSLTSQIAALNTRVAQEEAAGHDSGRYRDERQLLLGQLGQLVNINVVEDSGRMVNVDLGGRSIVTGNTAATIGATVPATGQFYQITLNGNDITNQVSNGKLYGLLQVRDVNIPSYLQSLDTLAGTLITQVNTLHTQGYDLNRAAGGNFFTPTAPGASAAQNIAVAITAPDRIAAARTLPPSGPPGDNQLARDLAGLANVRQAGLGSATFSDYFAGFTGRVGAAARDAADGLKTQRQIVRQVQNLRDSVSGVSLDEEMASIIQYQKAYEASARFVSIVSSLTEETMRLLGGR